MLQKIIQDTLTEADNTTWDFNRILGIFVINYYLILATIELIQHCGDFRLDEVAYGLAVLIGCTGLSVGYKYGKEQKK